MPILLAVDDDPTILGCYRLAFASRDVELITASTAAAGVASFRERRPDAVIMDVHLPDATGLEAFKQLHAIDAKVPVIFVTGDTTAHTAIDAMRLGALEYLLKPPAINRLQLLVAKAFEIRRLMQVPAVLPDTDTAGTAGELLIGAGAAMQDVYKTIGRVAPQDVTVLVRGESGTGKELVARAIYHYSRRAEQPFLAINCAAIPEQLLESEFFGHEKGAFTGAERRRIGKFEQCHGGTLFLDEVGDMTPLTQAKVLRVLQDRQFERVGGDEAIHSDVRVIAATNRDLEKMMAAGQFRTDLYYRLNVVTIALPPLRERREDLPALTRHFLRRYAAQLHKDVIAMSDDALDILHGYAWPGNVRELQSVVQQALLYSEGQVVRPDHLPPIVGGRPLATVHGAAGGHNGDLNTLIADALQAGNPNAFDYVITRVERMLLEAAMQFTGNNQSEAARALGISRSTLRIKLTANGLIRAGDS